MNIEKLTSQSYKIAVIGDPKKDNQVIRTDKNGVEFLLLSLLIVGGRIGAQIGKITRLVRADREPIVFTAIVSLLSKAEGCEYNEVKDNYYGESAELPEHAVAGGAFYRVQTPPYFMKDGKGDRMKYTMGTNVGKDVVLTEVKFFCFEEENSNPLAQYQRAVYGFDWATPVVDNFDEHDAEEVVENNAPVNPTKRR